MLIITSPLSPSPWGSLCSLQILPSAGRRTANPKTKIMLITFMLQLTPCPWNSASLLLPSIPKMWWCFKKEVKGTVCANASKYCSYSKGREKMLDGGNVPLFLVTELMLSDPPTQKQKILITILLGVLHEVFVVVSSSNFVKFCHHSKWPPSLIITLKSEVRLPSAKRMWEWCFPY